MPTTSAIGRVGRVGSDAAHPGPSGWRGSLRLKFARRGDRTRIVERRHQGPLLVQRPFYPEASGSCHVYLVHPPGGMVGGDELQLSVQAARSSRVLITTPAATKLYRSSGPTASLEQALSLGPGAMLEWLPQETIAFNGSKSVLSTRVELESTASFIGWEVLCLGRPAAGESFDRGQLCQRLEIWRDAQPLVTERLLLRGSGAELREPWGLGGHTTVATMIAVGPDNAAATPRRRALIQRLRACQPGGCGAWGVSEVSTAIVCRVLGSNAAPVHAALRQAWQIVRPVLFGCPSSAPRIWAT